MVPVNQISGDRAEFGHDKKRSACPSGRPRGSSAGTSARVVHASGWAITTRVPQCETGRRDAGCLPQPRTGRRDNLPASAPPRCGRGRVLLRHHDPPGARGRRGDDHRRGGAGFRTTGEQRHGGEQAGGAPDPRCIGRGESGGAGRRGTRRGHAGDRIRGRPLHPGCLSGGGSRLPRPPGGAGLHARRARGVGPAAQLVRRPVG